MVDDGVLLDEADNEDDDGCGELNYNAASNTTL